MPRAALSSPAELVLGAMEESGELALGLSPKSVAELFYDAIEGNKLDLFLATLAESTKERATSDTLGAFATQGWHLGREKWRKYGAHHVYASEDAPETDDDGEELAEVRFEPQYGKVPGYDEGTALGKSVLKGPNKYAQGLSTVAVTLVKDLWEWRVLKATF